MKIKRVFLDSGHVLVYPSSGHWFYTKPYYELNGLRSCFDPFIISSLHGHTKEGHELFRIALDMVPERPEECLFIDDSEGNLDRAVETGMDVALMDRKKRIKKPKYHVIHELRQIPEL